MNPHPSRLEARRRRLVNRGVAQHRQLFFETVRGSTVSYAFSPARRSVRPQVVAHDIDDPSMTFALQFAIILAMAVVVFWFRSALGEALQAFSAQLLG